MDYCVNALSGLYLIVTMLFKDIECLRTNVSMPSRAYTSLLQLCRRTSKKYNDKMCQCPLGLIPHCYHQQCCLLTQKHIVSMPSRAYTSLLHMERKEDLLWRRDVSMPSRAYTSLLQRLRRNRSSCKSYSVNALSGLYLIVTHLFLFGKLRYKSRVSMPSRAYTSLLRRGSFTDLISLLRCQCPLGLIPHCYCNVWHVGKRRHLYQCQCPLGLIPHCYSTPSKT